jgi:hypothetical protein
MARPVSWTILISLFLVSPFWFSPFTERVLIDGAPLPTKPEIVGIEQDYMRQCMGCHGEDGLGAPPAVPRLAGFIGYYARSSEGRAYLVRVPGVANAPIDEARLAALLNWTLWKYSAAELPSAFEPFTTKEVAILRAQRLSAPTRTRQTVLANLVEAGLIDPVLASAALANRRQASGARIRDTVALVHGYSPTNSAAYFANFWSSSFQSRTRAPLEPPQSAVIISR